jgi:hypothetical protein
MPLPVIGLLCLGPIVLIALVSLASCTGVFVRLASHHF